MKKRGIENAKRLIFPLILVFVNAGLIYSMRSAIGGKILIIAPLLIVQAAVSVLAFYLRKKKGWSHHQLFLLVAIVTGIAYAFIMPLGAVPDERNHFMRAYEVSEFHFTSEIDEDSGIGGRILPDSVDRVFGSTSEAKGYPYNQFGEIFSQAMQNDSESFQYFGNTSLYSPLVYFPQAVGIGIGRILHLPMYITVYLARIFNLIFWIALGYFSIRVIPFGKNTMLLLMFMPISMQAAASCQADVVTNASAIALFSFVLYKIKKPRAVTKRDYAIATALVLLVALSKIVYLPLCFLLYLLPKEMFKSKRHKIISVSLMVGLAVAANLIWLLISSRYLSAEFQPGVDAASQVSFVIAHPFGFLMAIFRTLFTNGMFFLLSFVGSSLSYFCVNLAEPYILFFAFYVFYTYLREDYKNNPLNSRQKLVVFVLVSACVGLIFASLYIQWTPVAAPAISGVQGRYFLPIALPLLFLLPSITKNGNKKKEEDLLPQTISVSLALTTYALASYMCYFLT